MPAQLLLLLRELGQLDKHFGHIDTFIASRALSFAFLCLLSDDQCCLFHCVPRGSRDVRDARFFSFTWSRGSRGDVASRDFSTKTIQ
jgi:hypothetical protein